VLPFKVCYLSTGIMDTAFDSQVLPLLTRVTVSGFDLVHIAFNPFYHKTTDRYLEKKKELNSLGIKTFHLRQTPPFVKGSLLIDEKRISNILDGLWGKEKRVVVHCRGHLNAYRGLLLKKRNPDLTYVIADLRGAAADEVTQTSRGLAGKYFTRHLRKLYLWIESQVVLRAGIVLCVSKVFKELLEANYNIKNVTVIPTFVNTSQFKYSNSLRELYRGKLGISNQRVLIYSGGTAPWQKIDSAVSLFSHLSRKVDNLFMLFLTHEPELVKRMIKDQINPDNFKVIRVPHGEVAGYLCAADVGILLREKTLTNHVASPIKFSEYMCCGLPCIISSQIGDTAEILRHGNAGIVLEPDPEFPTLSEFQTLLSLNRSGISDFMRGKFSSEIFIPRILRFYENAADKQGMN
jgi:glycosyltransferase involved in cell wall biosynthesis